MFDKTLDRLVCKEFDVKNPKKTLIIAGSWAAPKKTNSFKDKIKCSPSVGSAKKILHKLKMKGFEVIYCNEAYSTQSCHRCKNLGLKCLKIKSETSKKKDENPYEALRMLADTASMTEETIHDDDVDDDIDKKPSELQKKKEKKKKKHFHNRRTNKKEKNEIMKEKNCVIFEISWDVNNNNHGKRFKKSKRNSSWHSLG